MAVVALGWGASRMPVSGRLWVSCKSSLCPQRLYREQGENIKHRYTPTADLPEVLLAKLNAMNISEVRLMQGALMLLTRGS